MEMRFDGSLGSLHHSGDLTDRKPLMVLQQKNGVSGEGVDYRHFGLDIDSTGGGCTYTAGHALDVADAEFGGFGEQKAWMADYIWPIVPGILLGAIDVTYTSFGLNPDTAQWGTVEIPGRYRRCRFYDTGRMAGWILGLSGDSIHVPIR